MDSLTCTHGPKVEEERGRRAIGSARHVTQRERGTPTGGGFLVVGGSRRSTHTPSAEMSVPVVDFSACGLQRADVDVEDLRSVARELHAAFTQVGLVFLQNSGISPEEVGRGSSSKRTRAPRPGHGSVCVCAGQQGSRVEPEVF